MSWSFETARVDGLIKREETPKTMTEYYHGRLRTSSPTPCQFRAPDEEAGFEQRRGQPGPWW